MNENKFVAGDCAGASGCSSLQSDAEVARVLQEEEDSRTALQYEQMGSPAHQIKPAKRKGQQNQKYEKNQEDRANQNEPAKATEAAQTQEQADLALALNLAQEDIEKTGRDYLLEVDKLAFSSVDSQNGKQPKRYNANGRRAGRARTRYQRDSMDDIDVGGAENFQQMGLPVEIDLTNDDDDMLLLQEAAAGPWPVRVEHWGMNPRINSDLLPHSEEFSENDYEALLNLADQLGEVKKRGLDRKKIHEIPTRTFTKQSRMDDSPKTRDASDMADCKICLTVFENGDELRHLPCGHEYHQKCIDQWVQRNAVCPVCRKDVKP